MKFFSVVVLLNLPLAVVAQVLPPTGIQSTGVATSTVQDSVHRVNQSTPDGYVTTDDKTYVLKQGRVYQLTRTITLEIRPDGRVIGFEGENMSIPAGLMLTTDGRLVKAPPLGGEPDGATYQVVRGSATNSGMEAGTSDEIANASGLDLEESSDILGSPDDRREDNTVLVDGTTDALDQTGLNAGLNGNAIDPIRTNQPINPRNESGSFGYQTETPRSTAPGIETQTAATGIFTSPSTATTILPEDQGMNAGASTFGSNGLTTMSEPDGNEDPGSNTSAGTSSKWTEVTSTSIGSSYGGGATGSDGDSD